MWCLAILFLIALFAILAGGLPGRGIHRPNNTTFTKSQNDYFSNDDDGDWYY